MESVVMEKELDVFGRVEEIAIDGYGRYAEPRQQMVVVRRPWSPSSGSIAVLSALPKDVADLLRR